MKLGYLNTFLIICIVTSFSFMCSGCNEKKTSIVIKHESKITKLLKKETKQTGMIDLSDGRKVNFSGNIGPRNISDPNFDMVNVRMP